MVGRCSVRCARQLPTTYRGGDELRPGNGPELLLEAKDQHEELAEAELVGVDNSLGYILWACYFMIEQGYDMDPSLL